MLLLNILTSGVFIVFMCQTLKKRVNKVMHKQDLSHINVVFKVNIFFIIFCDVKFMHIIEHDDVHNLQIFQMLSSVTESNV